MTKTRNQVGSTFESWLEEEGMLEDATNAAIKAVLAWQYSEAMKRKKLTKVKMAEAMKTSRAQLDRVLDPKSGNVTLSTLQRAANAVGKTLKVELV
jgi:antitoxin HicB